MDRLKKEIIKNGKLKAVGSGRVVFKYKEKIWKIPYTKQGKFQTEYEKDLYSSIVQNLCYFSVLFPKPVFFGSVIMQDEVEIKSLAEIGKENVKLDLLVQFMAIRLMDIDLNELIFTQGNIGVQNGKIKLVDWGMSEKPHVLEWQRVDYDKQLAKTIRKWGGVLKWLA